MAGERLKSSPHMIQHLFPPVGSEGLWDLSISAIMDSKAADTFVLSLALASVNPHLNSSANCRP